MANKKNHDLKLATRQFMYKLTVKIRFIYRLPVTLLLILEMNGLSIN